MRSRLLGARVRAWAQRLRRRGDATPASQTFDAFISYSHARDAGLAAALKQGLHAFARPWYRVRALHVFLDNTNLAANPDLWTSIEEALDGAQHLVLLASPAAAASPWVDKEIRRWRATRPTERLVLVLTEGDLRWDADAGDFDWPASDAAPRALSEAFDGEPRWIDLRFGRDLEVPSTRNPRFRDALADVAAPLHGRSKEELVGEDVRQHRRTVRLVRATVVVLLALVAAAGTAALMAVHQRDRAEEQLRLATSRLLSAEAVAALARQHPQSLLLGLEALDASDTAEARSALYGALVGTPQALRYIQPRTGGPQKVALSPDGRTLAVGTTVGALELWDPRSGRRIRTIGLGRGPISDVSFAAAGHALGVVDPAGQVRLVDYTTGRPLGRLPRLPQMERATSVAIGAGGELATGHLSGEVRRWDVRTLSATGGSLGERLAPVHDVALSPGGRLLAAAADDGTVSVWGPGPTKPALDTVLVPGKGRASSVAFSPDGRRLAAGAQNGDVGIWATGSWRRLGGRMHHPGGEATAVSFSGDSTLLASGGFDNAVRLWDAATGERVGAPLPGHIAFVSDLAAAAHGSAMASAGADGNVVLWDPRRDDRLGQLQHTAGEREVTALAAGTGASRLAWVERGRRLRLGDGTGARALLTAGPGDEVRTVVFSPDGRRVAAVVGSAFTATRDTVVVWTVADGRRAGRPLRVPAYTRSLAFAQDGRSLFTGSFGGSVLKWNLAAGRRVGARMRGTEIALDSGGGVIAATAGGAGDGTVVLWNARSGRPIARLRTGRASLVWDVAISPDDRTVAAGDNDGNIVLWDLERRLRLGEPLTGHESRVEQVAFSPSGDLLASTDVSGRMLLWDVRARRALGPAVPGRHPSFAGDGDLLASAVPSGGIALRPLDPQRWRAIACSLANRNLGAREWQQFMGSDPYAPTCQGRERGHPASVAVSAD